MGRRKVEPKVRGNANVLDTNRKGLLVLPSSLEVPILSVLFAIHGGEKCKAIELKTVSWHHNFDKLVGNVVKVIVEIPVTRGAGTDERM